MQLLLSAHQSKSTHTLFVFGVDSIELAILSVGSRTSRLVRNVQLCNCFWSAILPIAHVFNSSASWEVTRRWPVRTRLWCACGASARLNAKQSHSQHHSSQALNSLPTIRTPFRS
jgi:hypothetical protein